MSPRRANPDAREALIEAARDEFARHGVEGARVEDIARRARISKGAFYLHFSTKEAVFQELLQRLLGVLAELAARREDLVCESGKQGTLDFRLALEVECEADVQLLEVLWRNRKVVAALDSSAVGAAAAQVEDFRRRMRALVSSRVADSQLNGIMRPDLDPNAIGDVILGAYEAFARRMIEFTEKPDLAAWARVFHAVLYEGTLAPAHRTGLTAPRDS